MKGRSALEVVTGAGVLVVAALFLFYAVVHGGRTIRTEGMALSARFDRIDGLPQGGDVRIAGVKVGSVTAMRIDPETFNAVVEMRVDQALRLPTDSSAEITSDGLLGGKYVSIVPGGAERFLADGGRITETQGSVSLESLLGRFIFSVTQLNQPQQGAGAAPATPNAPATARP
ncbi:outer membrane lipid asymmetry maintenance protein MlaD [Rhodovarius crocodyli]|uniref:Outer membrane lipid asymmetry maintenance protein MlaD n=1 Tax=Rhodovarius crocodyli TaxID=1979269 RepID=A0A437MGI7_9PROT|nr:outer membrane lipid asymmetry maintenance protein MlaD [Rhodovarius crocodyli]RVT96770.1 outer membrane lipid asymmetry maintenance protein MlaD [Rhodovarius crocodyli]